MKHSNGKFISVVALVATLWLLPAAPVVQSQAPDNNYHHMHSLPELKFQTQVDNSTVIKQTGQQQIFKCQVRLAFANNNNNNNNNGQQSSNNNVKWSSRSINATTPIATQFPTGAHTQLPAANLSALTIDWLRDEQLLEPGAQVRVGDLDELVAVVNVTLKSRLQVKGAQQNGNKFARLEIKNTLNGNQLKLTSRLRLNHLRAADSAHYKCVARASFILPTINAINADQQQQQLVDVVDQTLESNSTHLVVIIGSPHQTPNESRGKKWNGQSTSGRTLSPRPASTQKGIYYSSSGSQGVDDDDETPTRQTNQADDSTRTTSSTTTTTTTTPVNQLLFEDDEDLFRAPNGELINGQQQQQQQQQLRTTTNDFDANTGGQIMADWANTGGDNELPTKTRHLDWILGGGGGGGEQFDSDDDNNSNNKNHESPLGDDNNTVTLQQRPTLRSASDDHHSNELAKLVHRIAAAPELSCYTSQGEFYRGHASTASDARPCLNWSHVRRIMNLTMSGGGGDDNHNHCRNYQRGSGGGGATANELRGPWCFVLYNEQLDGQLMLTSGRHSSPAVASRSLAITGRGRLVRMGVAGAGSQQQPLLVVSRPCGIASCSEYLWLYIVAPPLGLIALLGCLLTLAIKTLRRKWSRNYHSIFSAAYKRHSNSSNSTTSQALDGDFSPGAKKNQLTNSMVQRIFAGRRSKVQQQHNQLSGGGKQVKAKSYLDDDIFEIVHDIDWSGEGAQSNNNTTSQSPLSRESFDLHSTKGFGTGESQTNRSTLKHSKSINPMLIDAAQQPPPPPPRLASNMSKSKSQAGPMFATLRCHVRQSAQQQHQRRHQVEALKQQASGGGGGGGLDWTTTTSSLSHHQVVGGEQHATSGGKPAATVQTGRLISCSSSSSSNVGGVNTLNNATKIVQLDQLDSGANILASELSQIDSSSVTISSCETSQPIYEGKFSQVLMAYLKQNDQDRTQATGRIGAQVAVCALKQQAALDTSVFQASKLRLRNLNHLNMLKLIGYVQYDDDNDGGEINNLQGDLMGPPKLTCGLIYDMAHLIDLSDWLKEQSKEALVAQADDQSSELSLRQNLTCVAKQIALGLDYLHDKNILYKDLACRNCFLDVTRMLVKLATFNIELEFGDNNSDQQHQTLRTSNSTCDIRTTTTTTTTTSGTEQGADGESIINDINIDNTRILNLKSMVRPKYLLDYYVIDSRPSECQLLPLSWIPLESILFNKFNKQTDIWSFGCLLYELFSLGEVAYFGYSSKQVIDSVRSNLMPPQPRLCPNGIYKLMCKCLSDIPTLRPNIKHIYEQLNLYSGQCSSFLNHHLCII